MPKVNSSLAVMYRLYMAKRGVTITMTKETMMPKKSALMKTVLVRKAIVTHSIVMILLPIMKCLLLMTNCLSQAKVVIKAQKVNLMRLMKVNASMG